MEYKVENYINDVMRTAACDYETVYERLHSPYAINLLHAAMGIETEAGEFLDAIKKAVFYGKKVDRVNLIEELGDLTFYIALAMNSLDITFSEVMEININKLIKRYPEGFTEQHAINRDLDGERKVLAESGESFGVYENLDEYFDALGNVK